jgi:transcriptional regulator GlxA family with amidase domain
MILPQFSKTSDSILLSIRSSGGLVAFISSALKPSAQFIIKDDPEGVFEENKEQLSAEEQMLKNAQEYVLKNLNDPLLKPTALATHLGYSTRQIERLLKKRSGFSSSAFIREIRLQKAHQIIVRRQFTTIKEVCYDVGFDSPATFSTLFKIQFGKSPSEV